MKEFLEKAKEIWGWIVIVLGLMSSTMYFFVDSKASKETIKEQSATIKVLVETVAKHGGRIESFDNAIRMFMENPPGLLMNELKELEEVVDNYHNINEVPAATVEEVAPPGSN